MTNRERELLQFVDPYEVSQSTYCGQVRMSPHLRQVLEYREKNYYRNICYTVAFAMRNV